ncbi:hypothetical protein OPIT5_18520 [Opitutaceae bacterium TAV5]|nr:hypothetical protein OPIT5_18520 [Opitutaceae bacterium TAV5]
MANDGNLYFTKSKSFGVALNIAEGVIFPVEKIEEARTYQATWDGLGLLPGFIIKNDANDEIKLVSHKEKGDEIILTFSVNEKSSIKIYRITKDRQMNYNFDLLEK